MKRIWVLESLTIVVTAMWVTAFVARLFFGTQVEFIPLDAAVVLVLGYWFTVRGRKNGNAKQE